MDPSPLQSQPKLHSEWSFSFGSMPKGSQWSVLSVSLSELRTHWTVLCLSADFAQKTQDQRQCISPWFQHWFWSRNDVILLNSFCIIKFSIILFCLINYRFNIFCLIKFFFFIIWLIKFCLIKFRNYQSQFDQHLLLSKSVVSNSLVSHSVITFSVEHVHSKQNQLYIFRGNMFSYIKFVPSYSF